MAGECGVMKSSLLSVCRLINTMNPTLTEPQSSVIAVNIDRESIEEIRKKKATKILNKYKKNNRMTVSRIDSDKFHFTKPEE